MFFIDESQRVTVKDIGSVDAIKHWAETNKAEVNEEELVSQFRCNGSDGYLAWLDDVLGIRETANYDIEGIDYEFTVVDTPQEMRQMVLERNGESNRVRILAGYCWNCPRAGRADTNYHDIKIGDDLRVLLLGDLLVANHAKTYSLAVTSHDARTTPQPFTRCPPRLPRARGPAAPVGDSRRDPSGRLRHAREAAVGHPRGAAGRIIHFRVRNCQ